MAAHSIRRSVLDKRARKRAVACMSRQASRRHSAIRNDTDRNFFRAEVNRMSNRQRSHWAQAGYPGLHQGDPEPLYAWLPRESTRPAPARRLRQRARA